MNDAKPKVGVGIIVVRDGKIMLTRRKGSHGTGEYAGGGGHLELLESFEECVLRELAEEAGPQLKVKNLRFLCVTNVTTYAPKHYIDIGMTAEWESGEPLLMEPDKAEGWDWYDIDDLPSPLFSMMENYIKAYKTGQAYFPR
jgi:8-oxo-dGTP diphosphatase